MPLSRLAWWMLSFLLFELFQLSAFQAGFALFYSLPGIFWPVSPTSCFRQSTCPCLICFFLMCQYIYDFLASPIVYSSFCEKIEHFLEKKYEMNYRSVSFWCFFLFVFTINADFSACCCFLDRKTQLLPKYYRNVVFLSCGDEHILIPSRPFKDTWLYFPDWEGGEEGGSSQSFDQQNVI